MFSETNSPFLSVYSFSNQLNQCLKALLLKNQTIVKSYCFSNFIHTFDK